MELKERINRKSESLAENEIIYSHDGSYQEDPNKMALDWRKICHEIEADVEKSIQVQDEPWETFYKRTDTAYKNGSDFLKYWSISTRCIPLAKLLGVRMLDKFSQIWKIIVEPQIQKAGLYQHKNPNNVYYRTRSLFILRYKSSSITLWPKAPEDPDVIDIREYMPTNFVKKAAMVWDAITLHTEAKKQWCKPDLESKTDRIWHDFFADFEQAADSQVPCLPAGAFYEGISLKPDLLMKNIAGVPSLIIENGRASATFGRHKDSPKTLAEGRLATSFTLAHFETSLARCFLVVNGEFDMSLTIMDATLIAEKSRKYNAAFISGQEEDSTLKYNLGNYTDIIKLFVLIFVNSKRSQYAKRNTPLSFAKTSKSVETTTEVFSPDKIHAIQNRVQGNKTASNTSNTSGRAPFQRKYTLWLGHQRFTVDTVEGSTRILVCQSSRYFGKVVPINGDILPFEFKLMKTLDHPNIMKLDHVIFDEEHRYCMGLTKWVIDATHMRRGAFENSMIARDILSALAYLHERGIVHADVKLDNIVVTDEGRLPSQSWRTMHADLIDFDSSFYTHNAPKDIRGTLPYIAPEVLGHQFWSPAMDMWSFGLLVFELFVGRVQNATKDVDMKQVVCDWYHSQKYKFKLVDLFFDLVMKCLETDPIERITASQALRHEFFDALAKIKRPNPITSYVLGGLVNWEGPVDWEALAAEDARQTLQTL